MSGIRRKMKEIGIGKQMAFDGFRTECEGKRRRMHVRGFTRGNRDEIGPSDIDINSLLETPLDGAVETSWEGDLRGPAKREADGIRGQHSFSPEYMEYIPPKEQFRVRHVSLFLRHGDRNPISRTVGNVVNAMDDVDLWNSLLPDENTQAEWDRLHPIEPKNVGSKPYDDGLTPFGQLTRQGAKECMDVGKSLRERYIVNQSVLPEKLDPSKLKIRTTNLRRTQQTAQNFLLGLYPLETRDSLDTQFPIETRPVSEENLFANPKNCPAYGRKVDKITKNARKTTLVKKAERELMRGLGYPEGEVRWAQAREVLTCYLLQNRPLPNNLTADDLLQMGDINGFLWRAQYSDEDVARLVTGRVFAEVFEDMSEAIEDPDDSFRMSVYAGHDSTLVPLLCAMGVYDGKWPPYASNIVIELAENIETGQEWVRIQYNFEEVLLMDGFWNTLEDFQNYMSYFVLSEREYKDECNLEDDDDLSDPTPSSGRKFPPGWDEGTKRPEKGSRNSPDELSDTLR
eukprot:CAMPEP_0167743578 /NCGR_PEP_ID=MMETSP0110_2-20121227/2094_1 /TAXON_ID=629695 /ORGANISM="Gymnochlora sp., Strain CCMP2014" /LENGTH=512 /DNA_ID=CAMNT_0007627965 /DNA_START=1585 /DNA_END=3123 /DNA_ORIENTATION=+